jgi:hypothetical protein
MRHLFRIINTNSKEVCRGSLSPFITREEALAKLQQWNTETPVTGYRYEYIHPNV